MQLINMPLYVAKINSTEKENFHLSELIEQGI